MKETDQIFCLKYFVTFSDFLNFICLNNTLRNLLNILFMDNFLVENTESGQYQMGSLAGAAHLLNNNAGVQRGAHR